ncbi:N-acetyltransferase 9-like protein [Centruroides vittatus]|uniref:N-acetyltransferase 9-like protein n=1 Tax=Centruroides vittatus TaxID=120091 RepID=UPI003510522C
MKINQNTKIVGDKIVLVPYKEQHVPKYHSWMQDTELRELTASEPLSLEQEYEMCKSWREDDDKCTFIVLDKEEYEATSDEIESMIGDVNLFLTVDDKSEAEVEIMIAESSKRGQGRGKEALLFMMRYGIEELKITSYIAKIKMKNLISIQIFEKIGFNKISESDFFQEVTLELLLDDHFYSYLMDCTLSYNLSSL